ncbi:MAG: NAD+ synthase [Candidatus Omnitrophica bacterium]|nr:NAD+ synthase [Candidatus Omnitrophota bacterium]
MKIALAQINTIVGDVDGNAQKALLFLKEAALKKADLVVFPELTLTGYPPEDLVLKAHFIDRNLEALRAFLPAVKGIVAVIGFVDRDKSGKLYNAAAVIAQGAIRQVYHKQALPNYSVFDEKRYFTPGDQAGLVKICGYKVGINICEDMWEDDGACATQARQGAELIINISCSPYEHNKLQVRQKLLQRRARAAGAPVVYVNLVGGQDELVFDGASMLVSPKGKVLAMGAQFKEELVVCDLAIGGGVAKTLSPLEEIFAAVVLGTKDYIQKSGFKKVLIGISGGIDSAFVAAVAVEAIGKENVTGISMPTRFNAEATKNDARRLARNLGIRFLELPIEKVFKENLGLLSEHFSKEPFGLAEENLQARIRGNLLMAFSNKFGWLVLTTGNKSEMATGYCTLYGDMSGGFAVIKDILKTQVYALSDFYNDRAGKDVIPRSIIKRAPSAELRHDQKDQDSLPPYSELDAILTLYIEDHFSKEAIVKKGFQAEMVSRVVSLVDRNEYKRRQSPPGVKISSRAFGKDWRLPIVNKYKG